MRIDASGNGGRALIVLNYTFFALHHHFSSKMPPTLIPT
jgi:hypothetical protein